MILEELMKRICAINPGSTSTKVAIFEDEQCIHEQSIKHSSDQLNLYSHVSDQLEFRKEAVVEFITSNGFYLNDFDAFVGRGGMLKPLDSGAYQVNQKMITELKNVTFGEHASNLGCMIAFDLAINTKAISLIADPVSVDEMNDLARVSGYPGIKRMSFFHALNHKMIAKTYAKDINKDYNDINLIIAHLGGGISVAAHQKGRVIDVNNAGLGDGPFTPERTGGLPLKGVIDLTLKYKDDLNKLYKALMGQGGLVAYLGTNDGYEIEQKINSGDQEATLIVEAMAYQISKEIGAMATALNGEVDGIILTGGLTYITQINKWITNRVNFIADVNIYPGEDEMKALAMNGLSVLKGEKELKEYI
jgi:butyrate kinase